MSTNTHVFRATHRYGATEKEATIPSMKLRHTEIVTQYFHANFL